MVIANHGTGEGMLAIFILNRKGKFENSLGEILNQGYSMAHPHIECASPKVDTFGEEC